MNLDHIGAPKNDVMKSILDRQKSKSAKAPVPVAAVPAPTFDNCDYVIPNLTATCMRDKKIMAGRIYKVVGKTTTGSAGVEDLMINVQQPDGTMKGVRLTPSNCDPCKPPPDLMKLSTLPSTLWVIALKEYLSPEYVKFVRGRAYNVTAFALEGTANVPRFTVADEKGAKSQLGSDEAEVCHGPTLDNCVNVICIQKKECMLTVGKIYPVIKRSEDGVYIYVPYDNGSKEPGYNKLFFGPAIQTTEQRLASQLKG